MSVDCCDVLVSVELVNYWILEPVGIYHSSSHLRGIWLQSSAIVVGFLPIPGVQTNENFWGIPTEYDSSGALFVMEILDTSASDCHSLICSSASWCIYCSQSQFISNPVLSNISETHNALLHKMKLYMILYLKEFLSGIYKGIPV